VRDQVGRSGPFGVGLRLAAEAASELMRPEAARDFAALLSDLGLYVFTLNGFAYGRFHGAPVKAAVYQPDWTETERVVYTRHLGAVLTNLLPAGVDGSISTVPGAYKANAKAASVRDAIAHNMALACCDLATLESDFGRRMTLALEPEPCCMLETTQETIDFFEQYLFSRENRSVVASKLGCSSERAEDLLRRHLGVCLDTCHVAVEFETAARSFERYAERGILVPKVQLSAGLKLNPRRPVELDALRAFDEPVYLHQVVQRNAQQLARFTDLPEAFESAARISACHGWAEDAQWRVHFHVPIFSRDCGDFESTQSDLVPLLKLLRHAPQPPHLEVETYTWDVLPASLRTEQLSHALARELAWVLSHLEGTGGTAP
jgi:sugar phosphate isomerase/epimerase